MITFLPYMDFIKSADCLDWKYSANRLNNQINEAIVINEYLLGIREDWRHNRRIIPMWKNFEIALTNYAWAMLYTWERKKLTVNPDRRKKLTMLQGLAIEKYKTAYGNDFDFQDNPIPMPDWLGDERFHSSHRSVLLAKNWNWYKQFGWKEEPGYKDPITLRWPYYWPGDEA